MDVTCSLVVAFGSALIAPLSYEDRRPAVLYILTACTAFGIWLVFRRYDEMRNRAVPFVWDVPEV